MQFVPWRNIADWKCIVCGYCCKLWPVKILAPQNMGKQTKPYSVTGA